MFGSGNRKAASLVVVVLVAYAGLTLTHGGEYWPFSVFPMFSKPRPSWSTPVIREIAKTAGDEIWQVTSLDHLPGSGFSLDTYGVKIHELRSVFLSNEAWEPNEILSLRSLIGEANIRGRRLLVMDVRGQLDPDDRVSVACLPLAILSENDTRLSPVLRHGSE
jgi:hypothetical protein